MSLSPAPRDILIDENVPIWRNSPPTSALPCDTLSST
nr:MAG TPA: hypothetical protein [Caudoviricetes sp.]